MDQCFYCYVLSFKIDFSNLFSQRSFELGLPQLISKDVASAIFFYDYSKRLYLQSYHEANKLYSNDRTPMPVLLFFLHLTSLIALSLCNTYIITQILIRYYKQIMQSQRGIIKFQDEIIGGNQCLVERFGDYVDLAWNKNTGQMQISSSKHQKYSYEVNQVQEIIRHIPIKHNVECIEMHEKFKITTRPMRPCACVYIQEEHSNRFLATLRPQKLSFGGQWVLPGGHLQKGQYIIDGGIRECEEEVNLKKDNVISIDYQSAMIWESIFIVKEQIKATSLVIFFKIISKNFDVKIQEQQVQKFKWIEKNVQQPQGGQWALGHLVYLRQIKQQQK